MKEWEGEKNRRIELAMKDYGRGNGGETEKHMNTENFPEGK